MEEEIGIQGLNEGEEVEIFNADTGESLGKRTVHWKDGFDITKDTWKLKNLNS